MTAESGVRSADRSLPWLDASFRGVPLLSEGVGTGPTILNYRSAAWRVLPPPGRAVIRFRPTVIRGLHPVVIDGVCS
jgi:hypothetical protein